MSKLTRYRIRHYENDADMVDDEHGEYVLFEDYERLLNGATAIIEFLPGVKAGPRAVFQDAMNRCNPESRVSVALWLDKDDQIKWTASGTNAEVAWLLQIYLSKLLQSEKSPD